MRGGVQFVADVHRVSTEPLQAFLVAQDRHGAFAYFPTRAETLRLAVVPGFQSYEQGGRVVMAVFEDPYRSNKQHPDQDRRFSQLP